MDNLREKNRLNQYKKFSSLLDKSELSCYLLGYLWADGYVSMVNRCVILSISDKDKEISEFFKQKGDWKVQLVKQKLNDKIFPMWKIQANSVKLAQKLSDLGFDKKTYNDIDKVLEFLPENRVEFFFRGLFDGDGNLTFHRKGVYRFRLAMNIEANVKGIRNVLDSLGVKSYIRKQISNKGHKSKTLEVSGKENVLKLFQWVYRTTPVFSLTRKYGKYLAMCAHIKQINYSRTNKKSIKVSFRGKEYNSVREASRATGVERRLIRKLTVI